MLLPLSLRAPKIGFESPVQEEEAAAYYQPGIYQLKTIGEGQCLETVNPWQQAYVTNLRQRILGCMKSAVSIRESLIQTSPRASFDSLHQGWGIFFSLRNHSLLSILPMVTFQWWAGSEAKVGGATMLTHLCLSRQARSIIRSSKAHSSYQIPPQKSNSLGAGFVVVFA